MVPSLSTVGAAFAYNHKYLDCGDTLTKIVVDYNRCESNARCMEVAPDIFQEGDDDKLSVLNEHPPASARERVLKAIRVCPKQALSLIED
jgi:ferredoxin